MVQFIQHHSTVFIGMILRHCTKQAKDSWPSTVGSHSHTLIKTLCHQWHQWHFQELWCHLIHLLWFNIFHCGFSMLFPCFVVLILYWLVHHVEVPWWPWPFWLAHHGEVLSWLRVAIGGCDVSCTCVTISRVGRILCSDFTESISILSVFILPPFLSHLSLLMTESNICSLYFSSLIASFLLCDAYLWCFLLFYDSLKVFSTFNIHIYLFLVSSLSLLCCWL